MLLSALRSYVETMGGSLLLGAEFPDGSPKSRLSVKLLTHRRTRLRRQEQDKRRAKHGCPELMHAGE